MIPPLNRRSRSTKARGYVRRSVQPPVGPGVRASRADENSGAAGRLRGPECVLVGGVVANVDGKGVGGQPLPDQRQRAAFVPIHRRAQLQGRLGGSDPAPAGGHRRTHRIIERRGYDVVMFSRVWR